MHDPVVTHFGQFDSKAILGIAVLLLKPLLAALCIAGVIEALRRVQALYARPRLLRWVAALVFWLYLSFLSLPMALCLLPVLWVYANSYLRWRDEAKPNAWRTAFAVTFGIQFIHNVLPAAHYLLKA